jgi:hypothetical protein
MRIGSGYAGHSVAENEIGQYLNTDIQTKNYTLIPNADKCAKKRTVEIQHAFHAFQRVDRRSLRYIPIIGHFLAPLLQLARPRDARGAALLFGLGRSMVDWV